MYESKGAVGGGRIFGRCHYFGFCFRCLYLGINTITLYPKYIHQKGGAGDGWWAEGGLRAGSWLGTFGNPGDPAMLELKVESIDPLRLYPTSYRAEDKIVVDRISSDLSDTQGRIYRTLDRYDVERSSACSR